VCVVRGGAGWSNEGLGARACSRARASSRFIAFQRRLSRCETRYVVYYPDYNGLGNRFRALLSWYLIAVLVRRPPHAATVPLSAALCRT
jgi:hypothetical protein